MISEYVADIPLALHIEFSTIAGNIFKKMKQFKVLKWNLFTNQVTVITELDECDEPELSIDIYWSYCFNYPPSTLFFYTLLFKCLAAQPSKQKCLFIHGEKSLNMAGLDFSNNRVSGVISIVKYILHWKVNWGSLENKEEEAESFKEVSLIYSISSTTNGRSHSATTTTIFPPPPKQKFEAYNIA